MFENLDFKRVLQLSLAGGVLYLSIPFLSAEPPRPAASPAGVSEQLKPTAPPQADATPAAAPAQTPPTAATTPAEGKLPLADLRAFARVFERIKSDYVESVEDEALLKSAIRGMLAGLDPHSSYLDADAYQDLQVGTRGEFGGLGIEVSMEDGLVKVVAPIDDTPAQRAGVQAGDLIVRIDDQPIKGLSLSEAVKLMRGAPGTQIELTIRRSGEAQPLKLAIEREMIHVASVKSRTLEPGYGYIRIANFQARTSDDLHQQLDQLFTDQPDGLLGLVLDLRNNPGGVLNSAIGVSDTFLTGGLIVYTQGRNEDTRMEFSANGSDRLDGAPLVVLVNSGSASASEIVAGALQDHRRAIVMGTDTFGKGSVQSIVPIDDSTALKLTTARYYTPSGRSIQAHGIVPDIKLDQGTLTLAIQNTPIKEANLMRHLEDAVDPEAVVSEAEPSDAKPLAVEDYPLSAALNVLKALRLANTPSVVQQATP